MVKLEGHGRGWNRGGARARRLVERGGFARVGSTGRGGFTREHRLVAAPDLDGAAHHVAGLVADEGGEATLEAIVLELALACVVLELGAALGREMELALARVALADGFLQVGASGGEGALVLGA